MRGSAGEKVLTAWIKDGLLADIGHQLRNPLNAVVGAAGLLAVAAGTHEQRELVGIIRGGADQLAALVDDLLEAAAIDSGKVAPARHPFDPRGCVEECLERIVEVASEKNLDMSLMIEAEVPRVVAGDSVRLEQVLTRLLRGAAARTERGGVGVELGVDPADSKRLVLRVRDSGAGLSPGVVAAVMADPGQESQRHMAPEDRIAALSLAICRRTVEVMGGSLELGPALEDGSGTEVVFSITCEPIDAELPEAAAQLDGMHVLVVAADAAERRLIQLQSETLGAIAVAGNPMQAIGLVQGPTALDLAIVEHRPPAIDGSAVLRAIRSVRGAERLPVVFVTDAQPSHLPAAAAEGAMPQATLVKPISLHALFEVMMRIGSLRPTEDAARQAAPGSLNVLVAEDFALNQNLMRRLLVKLGHNVDVVGNGLEAVHAIAEKHYDAVLLDVVMPEMDGLEAAQAICRRWPRSDRPRLIGVTALALPGDRERCLQAGMDDYLSKPVHADELAEALGHVTRRRDSAPVE